jgi:SAM-dependent methyltransferase
MLRRENGPRSPKGVARTSGIKPKKDAAKKLAKRKFAGFPAMKTLTPRTYRDRVKSLYDGPKGAGLAIASLVSMHAPLVGRMFRRRDFDVTSAQSILDIGSGAGQIIKHLVRFAPENARIVGIDISHQMLKRARRQIPSSRPVLITADMTHLPFPDETFDVVTCGYVLEHLQDPMPGLLEFRRVLKTGGRLLMLVTEDTVPGVWTSRTWKCRTYNRRELHDACLAAGLPWRDQKWMTPVHRFLKLGGIVFEAEKREV